MNWEIAFWVMFVAYWLLFGLNLFTDYWHRKTRKLSDGLIRLLRLQNKTLLGKPISIFDAIWLADEAQIPEPTRSEIIAIWREGGQK